jgi:hypothetical protein
MKNSVFLALLLAAPARAQMRVAEPVTLPGLGIAAPAFSPSVSPFALPAPSLSAAFSPSLAAPSILTPIPALAVVPARAVAVTPAAQVAALTAGVAQAAAGLGDKPGADAAVGAGREIEALLTGALAPASAATPEETAFVLGATRSLAERADELGAKKGLKAATMSGGDFIGLLEEARASAPMAPTPAADAAAKEVAAQIVRVARALIPADKPVREGLPRALAVWQVFDQEMAIAAEKGGLSAVVADAKLFASQVEASVEPAKTPSALEAPAVHPEDPEGYKTRSVEGSVFGWKPIAQSPNHGFPPLDALIRRALGEKKSPYAKGFTLPGSAPRESAAVFLYGERHTDGGLISENMKRLVEDAKPGKPMIILVEGYTDWAMRGYAALKYLADRGFDPDALAAKGIHSGDVEVRGWDVENNYRESKHPLLQHHMNLLELNRMAHGDERGWRYYRNFARAAWATIQGWRELWQAALVTRNGDLDRAVAQAVDDAAAHGATVHVIAGTDHLMQNPRLAGVPWLGRPKLRRTLHAALRGLPYWGGQPANTIP